MKTRRTYGSGSLTHLGGNRYRFQIRAEGKMLSRVFAAASATEANKSAGAIRLDLLDGYEKRRDTEGAERAVRQTWTVERYVKHYMARWGRAKLADTTRTRYDSIFRNQVCPHIGKLRMSEITPSHLSAMYEALASPKSRKRGDGALSGGTIATVHNVVRSLFSFAVEIEGDLPTNPAASRAARPRVEKTPKPRRGLSVAEVETFVKRVSEKAPDIAVPVMLSAYLGTRRGETVGLRWSDVDFDAATITVRRSVSRTVADGVRVKGTKTGKERTIPLDPHTLSELKRVQREQRRARLAFGRGWKGAKSAVEDYIVTLEHGEGMPPNLFSNRFRTFCKQEGLTITPHLLRHAWVSQMIALGFDAVTIAAMSGHSPDVLLKVYAHAFDARKREAMEALGDARKAARVAN